MKRIKAKKRIIRHRRIRAKVKGTANRPRVSVFRSNRHISVQLIDDESATTMISAGDLELSGRGSGKKLKRTELARELGRLIAQRAAEKKINTVVFDRGGYKYHGIIKALAEGAREGGLKM